MRTPEQTVDAVFGPEDQANIDAYELQEAELRSMAGMLWVGPYVPQDLLDAGVHEVGT